MWNKGDKKVKDKIAVIAWNGGFLVFPFNSEREKDTAYEAFNEELDGWGTHKNYFRFSVMEVPSYVVGKKVADWVENEYGEGMNTPSSSVMYEVNFNNGPEATWDKPREEGE